MFTKRQKVIITSVALGRIVMEEMHKVDESPDHGQPNDKQGSPDQGCVSIRNKNAFSGKGER